MRRCPICQDLLVRRSFDGIGGTVEADGCTSCGGVWLVGGQLKQAAESADTLTALDAAFPVQAISLGSESGRQHRCPDCQIPMTVIQYDRFPGIPLDNCPQCDGIWLTHGQASEIADRLFPPAAPEPPPYAYIDPRRAQAIVSTLDSAIAASPIMQIRQKLEPAEAIFGFETRNRYSILDASGRIVGSADEPGGGWGGILARNILGHWRNYEIAVFDHSQGELYTLCHPFCFWLDDIHIKDRTGTYLGHLCQRFSLISRCFDVLNDRGEHIMTVSAPFWHPWTFTFTRRDGSEAAVIRKRWPNVFTFLFTDRDDFQVRFSENLSFEERRLVLFAALFIDLTYFETKAGR